MPHLVHGDVVIIKDDDRNRNKWKLGIIEDLIAGRDGIVRVAQESNPTALPVRVDVRQSYCGEFGTT